MKTGMDRRYTVEFRVEAVRQVEVGDRTMSQVARSLEMSVKTLANWVYKTRKGQTLVSHLGAAAHPVTDAQAELSRLKQENARLRLEKEILKNGHRTRRTAPLKRNTCRPKLAPRVWQWPTAFWRL